MGFTSLGCGLRWRQKPEPPAREEFAPREPDTRRREKRETLRKRMPAQSTTSLAMRSVTPDEVPKSPTLDVAARAAELGVEPPTRSSVDVQSEQSLTTALAIIVVDPPAECAELSADPATPRPTLAKMFLERARHDEPKGVDNKTPQTREFKPYLATADRTLATFEAHEKRRSQSLPPYPSCLVPGPSKAAPEERPQKERAQKESPKERAQKESPRERAPKDPPRSATWSEEQSKRMTLELVPRRLGFGSGWWSRTDLTDKALPEEPPVSPPDLSTSSSGGETPPTQSPRTPTSPLSPEASLASKPSKPQLSRRPKTLFQPPPVCASPPPIEPSLSSRQSASNMSQLLARHASLESRRQTLLKLQEIENEQEQILEQLSTMPEEELTA